MYIMDPYDDYTIDITVEYSWRVQCFTKNVQRYTGAYDERRHRGTVRKSICFFSQQWYLTVPYIYV